MTFFTNTLTGTAAKPQELWTNHTCSDVTKDLHGKHAKASGTHTYNSSSMDNITTFKINRKHVIVVTNKQ